MLHRLLDLAGVCSNVYSSVSLDGNCSNTYPNVRCHLYFTSFCSNCLQYLLAAALRSRYDIEQDYIKQWKEVTARDSEPRKVTPFSFLWFVPVFIKYHVIPGPVRYVWWLVWSAFLRARYQIRKRLVLQGQSLQFSCTSQCRWSCKHNTIVSYCLHMATRVGEEERCISHRLLPAIMPLARRLTNTQRQFAS